MVIMEFEEFAPLTTTSFSEKVETLVVLRGWVDTVRKHGKMNFIDLRDGDGTIIQCVARNIMTELGSEDVVRFEGKIVNRPEHMENPALLTGKIEFVVSKLEVLNKCKPLPIPIQGDGREISDDKRMEYRYLDLRRSRMQNNIRTRAALIYSIRSTMQSMDFIEIETPILANPTQEGARDFVVPSRFHKGEFYALPQSPQQYKQLLMTAGFPKYYQIARCFRDETPRSDRGFEFTQFDMEMAWATERTVTETASIVVFNMMCALGIWDGQKIDHAGYHDLFPVMTYEEVMAKYGTDKPDIRTDEQKEKGELSFLWVSRFPMFKKVKEDVDKIDSKSEYTFMHNPFSAPIREHEGWLKEGTNVDKIIAQQYDLVCNGLEIGSGSVRSHERHMLESTYKIMGYSQAEIEASVGHMLEAFDYGTPPHGGIALGIDRLAMLACKETSMKEVIAFPTTSSGRTAITNAPLTITPVALKELGLK